MKTDKTGQFVAFYISLIAFIFINSNVFAQFSTNSPSTVTPQATEKTNPVLSQEELEAIRSFTSDTSSRKATDFPPTTSGNLPTNQSENSQPQQGYQSPLGTRSLESAAEKESTTIGPPGGTRPISMTVQSDPADNSMGNNDNKSGGRPGFWRLLFSLLAVVAVIVGLALLAKKMFPSRMNLSMGSVLKVLGRTAIDNRHGLTLLKFGDDLLLLAVSGDNLRLIDKVSDPEKIAFIMGSIESERVNSISKSFSNVFGKARDQFQMGTDLEDEEIVEEFEDEPGQARTDSELEGLLKKVKGLSKIKPRR